MFNRLHGKRSAHTKMVAIPAQPLAGLTLTAGYWPRMSR
ncbi:hypothetical protein BZL30_4729 [Mycobacterium kansasii]|uniref:Uncharacterized protein n=1 Tax=Mycobacterium kansasii TaxID=1768 RepID=A0A1V3X4I5_MYCKA|nr:hypothetical protein BZL30_4729 [Mycobacterium kansasii]